MKSLLEKISGVRVLVVGDLMLDHYLWGDATRISPEAPVPVVNHFRDTYTAGGAANVAFNLRALGCECRLFGLVGDDEAADRLLSLLADSQVKFDPRLRIAGLTTICKTRIMVRQQQLCRLDREGARPIYSCDTPERLALLEEQLDGIDAVIFSDYAKGVISSKVIEFVQSSGKVPLLTMDPKPIRPLAFRDLDLITPNREESLKMAGIDLGPHEPFPQEEVCRRIYEKHSPKHLVVTMGADGMLVCDEGKPSHQIPTYAQEVFDVSGAGDTVIATLTAALAAGAPIDEAAHFANTAAGVVVGKLGTATATPAEILAASQQRESIL